jgi:hypothetical protein
VAGTQNLYQKVVQVTYIYLGPAADRFVTRQVVNHLHKRPEQLSKSDMPELIDWIKLAMGFLTQDQKIIEDYISRLRNLDGKRQQGAKARAVETA